jgi:winged helix-turn helix protein
MHTTPLVLTVEQRQRLEALLRRPTAAQRLVERALIVLAASDGRPLRAIARDLAMRPATVRKWCRRFELRGIDGLQDRARSGRPRCISASDRCLVIATACQDPAEHGLAGHSNWSASLFAASPPDSSSTPARSSAWSRRPAQGGLCRLPQSPPRPRPRGAGHPPCAGQLEYSPWNSHRCLAGRASRPTGDLLPPLPCQLVESNRALGSRIGHFLAGHRWTYGLFLLLIIALVAVSISRLLRAKPASINEN